MNDKKIMFVVHRQSKESYYSFLQSLSELIAPDGFMIKATYWGGDSPYKTLGEISNSIYLQTDARYKIYVDDRIQFLKKDFLMDLLYLFQSNSDLGLIGVCGGNRLTRSGFVHESEEVFGGMGAICQDGHIEELRFGVPSEPIVHVQAVTDTLIAAQWGILLRPNFQAAHVGEVFALETWQQGFKVAVPYQEQLWCALPADLLPEQDNEQDASDFRKYYAPYLESGYQPDRLFFSFAADARLGEDFYCLHPERVCIAGATEIGRHVSLRNTADAWIKMGERVKLADHVILETKGGIELASDVALGNHVTLLSQDSPKQRLFRMPQVSANDSKTVVERGALIETGAVLYSGVRIGRGSRILPHSVVMDDIPDYCVAGGNPAWVVQAFDKRTRQYVDVKDEQELQRILQGRKEGRPIFTVGIPTYNRSYYLRRTLGIVLSQLGNDDLVEVLVSDNASPDDTQAVCEEFSGRYANFRYTRNDHNIGADNVYQVYRVAKGDFVLSMGDDDYLNDRVFCMILEALVLHPETSILCLRRVDLDGYKLTEESGLDCFMRKMSTQCTFISMLVFRRDYLLEAMSRARFKGSQLSQMEYEALILTEHPRFMCLEGKMLVLWSGEAANTLCAPRKPEELPGFADMFLRQYLDILLTFEAYGVKRKTISDEKYRVMEMVLHHYKLIHSGQKGDYRIDEDALAMYDKYYADEPYYEKMRQQLQELLQSIGMA